MKVVSRLPPNHRGRAYENVGLKIRAFSGTSIHMPIDPFALAKFAKIRVVEASKFREHSPLAVAELTGRSCPNWSAVTLALPDGWQLSILNPKHTPERKRATLMEEICHIILGHEPTRISTDGNHVAFRDYNPINEQTAYGVGAAVLVPYEALRAQLQAGKSPKLIARRYGVSIELVLYRIKITMLWKFYKALAS